jgi:hypothetical protein
MDDKEESCCTIDYQHHKDAKIRPIKDHYKEAQVPGGYTIACDEPVERGGLGKGLAPLQYLVASVGL